MINEVDRLVIEFPDLYANRQQFVESCIRQKIEQLKALEAKVKTQSVDE